MRDEFEKEKCDKCEEKFSCKSISKNVYFSPYIECKLKYLEDKLKQSEKIISKFQKVNYDKAVQIDELKKAKQRIKDRYFDKPMKYELLEKYTKWLLDNGYTDTDTICEDPKAVDAYLEEEEK